MRTHARLVVIGAGIVGTSAVYHLTRLGWRDIVVVEQGPLFETGGSSGHAPGLVFQTNPSRTMTEFAKATVKLYSELSFDGAPCFYPVGSVEVAYTPERLEELKRRLGFARAWGLSAELITAAEVRAQIPILDETKIYGAYHVQDDGVADAVKAAEAMTHEAEKHGAFFHGSTAVTGIDVADGRVRAVLTPRGRIVTEQVLVCAGIWGPRVGRLASVSIPLMPCQHLYARTAPVPALAGERREVVHSIMRHQDRSMYFRQHAECYGFGSYRHQPLLVDAEELGAWEEGALPPAQRPFTPEAFVPAQESAVELLPALRGLPLTQRINGMFAFTPDGFPLLGASLEARGLWVAEAVWITHAGGAGRAVAEWMATGVPNTDVRECDLNRFAAHVHSRSYLRARATQQYREVYDIIHPLQQMEYPRNLRLSPFHARLQEHGAVFFESAGWERPQWFEANEKLLEGAPRPARSGWEARNWSPIQGAEHRATRERVGLFDLTPFTKIEIGGPGALALLQHLSANQIDRPLGRVVYTAMLDQRGGIVCDLTITRLGPDRFLVVTGGASGMHDLAWIRRHAPPDGSVEVIDVSSKYCAVGLWGPNARRVLREVSSTDVGNDAFPYFTTRQLVIGMVPAFALRVSYVGELGWEIYTLTEYGQALWDALWDAGSQHGLVAVGGGAFDSLRLEKGYRLWGADIHSDYNPYEAGLTVDIAKGDFQGRDALCRITERGITRKLCWLTLDDPNGVVMGKEPLLDGDRVLGYVTSANYGYTVRSSIACGYLPVDRTLTGTRVDILYFNRRLPATVADAPLFDPKGLRLRS